MAAIDGPELSTLAAELQLLIVQHLPLVARGRLASTNSAFSALLERPWESRTDKMKQMVGIATDHNIAVDDECLKYVREYAGSQDKFFGDFAASYAKMTRLGAARLA